MLRMRNVLKNTLLLIIFLDNVASALTVSVIMHILHPYHTASACQSTESCESAVIFTGYLVLLSPTYLFFTPIIGRLADVYGRYLTLMLCLALSVAGYISLLAANNAQNIYLALMAIMLLNAGASSMTPVQAFIADISQGKQKSYLFGVLVLILLPVYLLVVEGGKTWLNTFQNTITTSNLYIMIALAVSIINVILLKASFNKFNSIRNNLCKNALNLAEIDSIFTKPVQVLLVVFALFEFASGWYIGDLSDKTVGGGSLAINGFSIALYYKVILMVISLTILYPILMEKITTQKMLRISISFACLGLLGCSILRESIMQWFFMIPLTVGEVIFIPTVWRLLSDLTDNYHQGLIMGVKASVWALAWSLGLLAGSEVGQLVLPYVSIIIINGLMLSSLVLTQVNCMREGLLSNRCST